MFPNLRLIIVAISASLLAIICGMTLFIGVFAAFSVAREPFAEIAATRPPLQIGLAGENSAPVAEGKTAPFGIRFQVHAPQVPNGPVIVTVPAALDRTSPPESPAPVEPVTNPAANAQSNAPANAQSVAALRQDDAPPPSQEASPTTPAQAATNADAKVSEKSSAAKQDAVAGNDTSGAMVATQPPAEPAAPERPATASTPHHLAPQIRIASREADNPASVATSPAPTLVRKGIKRRKLAIHLHQPHHFRRPRIHQIVSVQTQGFVQPNSFGQSTLTNYAPGAYGQPNGFGQSGFGFAPAAIKPRPARWRHVGVSSQ